MTLVSALRAAEGQLISTAQFNSYTPNDGEIVSVLITGNWFSGDVVWTFRYRAVNPDGSANGQTYQWDFMGGSPIYDQVNVVDTNSFSGAWRTFVGAGLGGTPEFPSFPLHGLFLVRFGAKMEVSADGNQGEVGVALNADDPTANARAAHYSSRWSSVMKEHQFTLNIGDHVWMQYTSNAGTASFDNRWMTCAPIRVMSG